MKRPILSGCIPLLAHPRRAFATLYKNYHVALDCLARTSYLVNMAYARATLCLFALYTRIAKYCPVEPIVLAEVKVFTMTTHRNAISVFISCANADEPLLRELEAHLSSLNRQELISTWHNRHIAPGTNWSEAIDEHMSKASLILLLVSSDFLASDYCYGIEMQRAMERNADRRTVL